MDGQSLVQDLNQGSVTNPEGKCCIVYHSVRLDFQIRICHCQDHTEYDKGLPFYHHVQSQMTGLQKTTAYYEDHDNLVRKTT
jgi:hypothetical protein